MRNRLDKYIEQKTVLKRQIATKKYRYDQVSTSDLMKENRQLEYALYEHHSMTKVDLNIVYTDRLRMYNFPNRLCLPCD